MKTKVFSFLSSIKFLGFSPILISPIFGSYFYGIVCTCLIFLFRLIYLAFITYSAYELKNRHKDLKSFKIGDSHFEFHKTPE